jgi:phosphatidylglycerol---prolipoprotein diacylglyceryl transferase
MWTHNLNPVLVSLFGLEIRYYGLVYVLGFCLAIYWLIQNRSKIDCTKDEVYDYVFYLMVAVIVGSRLFHIIFWEPSYYFSNPIKILYIWQGGMAFHGGLVGAILATTYFAKKKKIPFYRLADILVIPALIALAMGRIANFINAELPGYETTVSWCVDFGDQVCRHPYQLYAAIKRLAILGIVIYIQQKSQFKEGFLFWITIFLLGVGRFFLDYLRVDDVYFSLSMGQWMAVPMVLTSLFILGKNYKGNLRKLFKFD